MAPSHQMSEAQQSQVTSQIERNTQLVQENANRVEMPTGMFILIDRNGQYHFFTPQGEVPAEQLELIQPEKPVRETPTPQVNEKRVVIGAVLQPLPKGLHGLLGLDDGNGFLVTHVLKSGPAAKAGMQEHDLLLKINDESMTSIRQLRDRLNDLGEVKIDVTIRRKQDLHHLKLQPVLRSKINPGEVDEMMEAEAGRIDLGDAPIVASTPPWTAGPMSRQPTPQFTDLYDSIQQLRNELKEYQDEVNQEFKKLHAELKVAD